ncbi:MAG: polysaccharide biosynthesis C-terminal domain-containing protein [Ignavibacteria bacterium]|nr:polysaccharide biosynthesis C-terminal domain-containing protein [Ignavibacteria bacterium]
MLKKLIRESFIYGLSGYISKFIGVFLLPLYTSVLTPSDYGILDLLNSVSVFTSFIIISGTDASLGYYYFRREFQAEKNLLVSSGLIIRISFAVTVALILMILAPSLSDLLFHGNGEHFIRLYAVYIVFNSIYFFTTELLRFSMKPWIYTVFSSGNVLVNILSAILFVLILEYGVTGAIYASIISYGLFAIAGVVYVIKNFKLKFSLKWAKNILFYGFPLIGTAVASWVLNYSDRYFLNYLSGLNQIGIYSVGLKVAAIMGMLAGAFQMAWGPFAADIQYEPNARRIYAKVFQIYFILNILLVFNVSIFAGEILRVLTQPAYYSAVFVIPLLCFSAVFTGAYFIAAAGIGLTKKLQHTIWITVVAAAVNILMNTLLTPSLLSVGSAIAILSANFVMFLLTLLTSQKYYKIEYKYGFIIILILISTLLFWVSTTYNFNLVHKIMLASIYLASSGVYIYKSYKESAEFKKVFELIRKFRNKEKKSEE